MFNVTERVRTGLYLLDSDNVNSLTSPPPHFECLLATSASCLSSEVDEKLIELVCKCKQFIFSSSRITSSSLTSTILQITSKNLSARQTCLITSGGNGLKFFGQRKFCYCLE